MRTKLEYDARGRLAKSIVVDLTGIDDAELRKRAANQGTYRYDESGHVTDDDRGTHYEWDDRGRLVREHHSNVDTIWDYACSDADATIGRRAAIGNSAADRGDGS